VFWQALHGNVVSVAGWKVDVPQGYFVRDTPDGAAFFKLGLGIPFFDAPYGHVTFASRESSGVLFSHERHYAKFEDLQIEMASKSGEELSGRRKVPVVNRNAYCIEFSSSVGKAHSLVRCMLEGTAILVSFEGHPKYVSDVYTMLQRMMPDGEASHGG